MNPKRHKTLRNRRRHGIVIVAVVVLLAVAMTLFGIWAKSALRGQRLLRQRALDVQARRLAEAGIWRVAAQLSRDAKFSGETWSVPAESLGGPYAASVEIRVEPADDHANALVRATAEHPAGAVHRARHTLSRTVPINRPTNSGVQP